MEDKKQHDDKTVTACSVAAILTTAGVYWLNGTGWREIGLTMLTWIFIYALMLLAVGRFIK